MLTAQTFKIDSGTTVKALKNTNGTEQMYEVLNQINIERTSIHQLDSTW